MLPFLKPKKLSSVIMMKYHKDGDKEVLGEEGEPDASMMEAAENLISAITRKDAKSVVSALMKALQAVDNGSQEKLGE